MTLLDRMARRVTRLVRAETPDGEGGVSVTLADGASFDAACARESAQPATVGGRVAQSASWVLLCPPGTGLRLHECVRLDDGVTLRVTSTPQAAPAGSGIAAERVTAEEVGA